MLAGVKGKKGGNLRLSHGKCPREITYIFGKALFRRSLLSSLAFGFIFACFNLLLPVNSFAAEVTIAWTPSPDANVVGYKVHYGPTSREDQFQVDAGKNTSITISNVQEGGAYSFVVTAYDNAGGERRLSNKATVSNIRDKDTHFLPAIPARLLGPRGAPGIAVPQKTFLDTPPGCRFAILPASQTIDSSGGWGVVEISAGWNCPWTAVANVPWAIITSNNSGTRGGAVYYMVKANSGVSSRSGTLTVAGQTFKIIQAGLARHTLYIRKIGTGAGIVTSVPAGTDFEAGTTVTLSAAPSPNSDFAGWSGRCSGKKPTCSVTMNSRASVNAAFKLKTFIIAARAGANGSISPSGRVAVNYGGSQKFIVRPNRGYKIGAIKVDGVPVGEPESLLIGNIMGSHRIEAVFLPLR
jgi:Divergent InlB B-repeat domain/Fibronectin type III domain